MRQRSELHNLPTIALTVAKYYGFLPIGDVVALRVAPTREDEDRILLARKRSGSVRPMLSQNVSPAASFFDLCVQGSVSLLPGTPTLTYSYNAIPHASQQGHQASGGLTFEVTGAQGSGAEALLMHAMHAAIVEAGLHGTMVLNSVGDRSAFTKFRTDCMNYYRRQHRDLHTPCREAFTDHIEKIFECRNEQCATVRENAPRTLAYLNEASRRHFKEVLEYLELLRVPYYINDQMIAAADPDLNIETVFALFVEDEKDVAGTHPRTTEDSRSMLSGVPLIYGGRREKKSANGRERIHQVYATIALNMPRNGRHAREERPQQEKCKAYFVQFGPEARRKNFFVLETLRRMHIPVSYSLVEEKLGEALRHAEERSIPFTIIMGQKEAMSDSVIVRRTETRAQETISLSLLPAYLKHAR